jgi:hypothetical protein
MNKKSLSERDICTKFITPVGKGRMGQNQLQPFLETYTDSTRYKSHKTNFYRDARSNEKRVERVAGEEPCSVE